MINDDSVIDTRRGLEMQRETFQDAARECVESFFQKECRIAENWVITDRLEGMFDHISTLGCSNNFFQAIMTANIDSDSIPGFLGEDF
jgi:hypothetical protein